MLTRSFKIGMNAGHIVTPVIHVNQYDHDEQWIFTLVDDNGVVYTPTTGGIVGLKADGNVILNAGTVNSSGQVVINETQQMTAAAGDATYELLLDNSTHGCANFTVRVEPKPGDNATYSDSDLSLLQEAIDSTIPANIEAAVQDWMDDNLAPSQWVIDNTLSISGAAADAKKTGDGLNELKTAINEMSVIVYPDNIYDMSQNVSGKRLQANGGTYNTPDYFTSDYIDVSYVGNKTLYLSKNDGEAANFNYVCWYDENKTCISYSSTVEGSKQNDPDAKYMRFSAVIANYELNTYINIGSRKATYTPYFKPYHTTHWNKYVLFGYSNSGAKRPTFNLKTGVSVLVNGFLTILDVTYGKSQSVQKYNSNPETFSIVNNQSLVYDYENSTISVNANSDIYVNANLIPLVIVNQNGIISGGQWLPYLYWQTTLTYYKEPVIPYSPRIATKESSSLAGDQSMCIIGNWLVCWDGYDSDGLVHILNKETKEQIKLMTQTLGHGSTISYNDKNDALMVTSSDGTYIINDVTTFIEENTAFTPSDGVLYSGVDLGCFGELDTVSYCVERIGAVGTIGNYVVKKYTLSVTNGSYDGGYTLSKTYTNNYRLGTGQDCKFYNGFLYKCFGYQDAVIYKITFDEVRDEYIIAESYNVTNSETLEAEGIIVSKDMIMISARDYNNISNKYFIEVER